MIALHGLPPSVGIYILALTLVYASWRLVDAFVATSRASRSSRASKFGLSPIALISPIVSPIRRIVTINRFVIVYFGRQTMAE